MRSIEEKANQQISCSNSQQKCNLDEYEPRLSRKRSHADAFGGTSCVLCGETRLLSDKQVRAAAAKVTCKVNSSEDKNHVLQVTREWRQLAQDIQHAGLIAVIGTNKNPTLDLRAAEVFYDLSCYSKAKRKQARKAKSACSATSNDEEFIKLHALKQIVAYIKSNQTKSAISFKLASLQSMFAEILQRYGVEHDRKATNFFELLKLELPELQKFYHGHGSAIYVTLNRTFSKKLLEPENAREELEVKKKLNVAKVLIPVH